jgi:hypothetical protein
VVGKLWIAVFVVYAAVALPLLAWALVHAAA